ncbi:Hypothetical protein FKW44_018089 [Caligus rogercresseyi]|uniref:Uncharacterized protein n=1 Tax=Caligus rogercresseyi TaxID=217165 RepID=A0A7T8GTW2_CALRO|nr:Hypothetical protein FKW44_018089 [Caligus rogercresseyi]
MLWVSSACSVTSFRSVNCCLPRPRTAGLSVDNSHRLAEEEALVDHLRLLG